VSTASPSEPQLGGVPAASTAPPKGPRPTALIKIAAVFVSGLAVNWISDLFAPAVSFIIVIAFLAFILLVMADSPTIAFNPSFLRHLAYRDTIKFGLGSMLLGALTGALWVIPLFPSREYRTTFFKELVSLTYSENAAYILTRNYEICAAISITILGIIACWRGARFIETMIFGIAAIAGMSLTLVSLKPENYFVQTFGGWLIFYILVVLINAIFPDVLRLFGGFWRVKWKPKPAPRDEQD
jgi:hypothetical protein